ncbi:MAG: EAL domain-containing protein, partial [Sphingomonadales bacterium]|nr:EAL domain-containing protein [Sphingomonadales bacterium]
KPHLIDFLVSILHMAYALGASTVCEGIETEEEKTLAETLGFDALQGFLISRPISIGRLRKAIERQEKDRATIERRRA